MISTDYLPTVQQFENGDWCKIMEMLEANAAVNGLNQGTATPKWTSMYGGCFVCELVTQVTKLGARCQRKS